MHNDEIQTIIANNIVLNDYIMDLSEKDIHRLLIAEQDGKSRDCVFDRLVSRYSSLMRKRIKGELRLGLFE
jgi:hypothetical protein